MNESCNKFVNRGKLEFSRSLTNRERGPSGVKTHSEHLEVCEELLTKEIGLEQRLLCVLRSKIEASEPYHRFAGQLFRTAADPQSPLSPFSAESEPVRRDAPELLRRVVEGSDIKRSAELWDELPNLLWLYEMAIILFWVHDSSPGRQRTYRLIDKTVEIVARLIKLSSLAPMRPIVRRAIALTAELREPPGVQAG